MVYLAGLVGLLLAVTAEARVGSSTMLDFCSETEECLLFDPICKNDDYEARHYSSVKWVTTKETSWSMMMATATAFRRLFKYINGDNDQNVKVSMTAPVVVEMEKSLWGSNDYTMSFMLPSEHQTNPPTPNDNQVSITNISDMNVYVRSYGGYMMSISDWMNADQLENDLLAKGVNFKADKHYAVGYNSPMTMFNRHNEVWFVAEGTPSC